MKLRILLIVTVLTAILQAQDPCPNNFAALAAGFNTAQAKFVPGSTAGTAAYGRKLADLSGYCGYSYTAGNWQGSAYSVTTGVLFRIFNKQGMFSIYAGAGVGLLNSSEIEAHQLQTFSIESLTKLANDQGGLVVWHKWMPKNVSLVYAGRRQATADGDQSQHRFGVVYGF